MNSFGNNSKFLGNISNPCFQVVRRNFVEQRGDEGIKWQWSVRESACQDCHKYKVKKSWLAKLFHRKHEGEELTNRRTHVVRKPKIWEWEYYDYLLPECKQKCVQAKSQHQYPSKDPCVDPTAKECEGKRILIHLSDDHQFQKHSIEKLSFDLKDPFKLNEVCCKANGFGNKSDTETSSTEEEKKCEGKDKDEKKDNFCCLNNLIDENKQKKEDSKKSQCD